MILRRVIDHVKVQNWTAVALDFVVVVVGVFIGIQVANWNETRQERAQQQRIELRLRSDFRLLDEALTGALTFQEEAILALETLRAAIDRGKALSDEDKAIKIALVRGRAHPSFQRKSATYSELVSSGRLHLIRSDALRTALALYDESIDNSLYNIRETREPINNDLIFLAEHATLTPIEKGNVGIQAAVSYDIPGMARDTESRSRLDVLIVAQTWIYANMAGQRRAIDAVLDAMEDE